MAQISIMTAHHGTLPNLAAQHHTMTIFAVAHEQNPSTQKENKLYKKKSEKVNPNGKARFSSLKEDW